ncbi:MAG: hypothetical protein HKN91_17055 [Acidimicrobiia bacterium]|nr:hypothetical protein [Acidimicrobiia bacterium]
MISTRNRKGPLLTWARKRSVKIILDTTLLAAFVTEFVTREGPDYTFHSWVGIALIPIITIHLSGNVAWIKRVWNHKRDDREFGLGVLNATLGALAGVCIATGFPIWLEWSDAAGWTAIHTITGMASIIVMFIHLWSNRARVARLLRS